MSKYIKLKEQFKNEFLNGKTFSQIASAFSITEKVEKNQLRLALEKLEKERVIYLLNEKYYLKTKKKDKKDEFLTGIVRVNERGFGFLIVDGETHDYFVPPKKMLDAFQGDKVIAKFVGGAKGDEVEIVKVLQRGIKRVIGVYYNDGKVDFLRPDDKGYVYDIILYKTLGASQGDKVVVEITDFPKNKNPKGRVVEVLGKSLEIFTEEKAIILNNQIEEDFSQSSLNEALNISQKVPHSAIIDRLDLRNELIFTIDGETARDFDDAVSLKILDNGNYFLGVHIADVSNYVTQGSALDKQAYSRATSVYLPDKVIPMLPFELSNGICSLVEGEDRLTLSVLSEIDKNGKVVNTEFFKSVIKSSYRLTYTIAQKIIDGDKETCDKYSKIVETFNNMLKLKNILAKNRLENGEIDLSVKEADVFLNSNGKVEVSEHIVSDATKLIEQFMIFANERVAEFMFDNEFPCIYRVHDKPSLEKTTNFRAFLSSLGVNYNISGEEPIEYKNLLDLLKGKKTYSAVNKMMLRSMQKAEYSSQNIGHFGLASSCYLHFTSPIRRYPDLVVHRILKDAIDGKKGQLIDLYGDFVVDASKKSSEKEKNATLCERDVDDLYKVFYMQDYIGKEFVGTISGVTNFGVFVELENTVEGIIRLENLPRKNYQYLEEKMRLECGKFSLTLGDKVKIVVIDAVVSTRKVEFAYISKENI